MRLLRLCLFTVAAAGLCWVGALVGVFVWGSSSMCDNELLSEVMSPGAKLKAVVFERDCGATTGFSTQVSIIAANASLKNEPGNVLVADANHGAAPAGRGGGPEVSVKWRTDAWIYLAHDARARVMLAERKVGEVRVDHGSESN